MLQSAVDCIPERQNLKINKDLSGLPLGKREIGYEWGNSSRRSYGLMVER
jgi:hypothetical protein